MIVRDRFDKYIKGITNTDKVIFITSFIAGLLAYGFVFTNKLPNHDDVMCLFSKGETLTSGRWGLYLLTYIVPNYSMPWLYGIISLLLLCVMACTVVKIYKIDNIVIAVALACLMVTFPAQTATFGYMFTSVPYALSLLLAVLSVYLYVEKKRYYILSSILVLLFAISIYQAYLCIAAVFHVVLIIQEIVADEKDEKKIIKDGLTSVAVLLTATLVYYLIQMAVMHHYGINFNQYASEGLLEDGLIARLLSPYRNFISYFYSGHYDLVRPGLSRILHCICGIIALVYIVIYLRGDRTPLRKILLIFCLVVFPLAVNCVCLIVNNWHNLMTWGLTGIYVLAAVLVEESLKFSNNLQFNKVSGTIIALSMAVVSISNIFYSNEVFLKMYLQYETAYSFYSGIVTQVKMTPGFDENSKLALIGEAENLVYTIDEIDTDDLVGVCEGLINIYSRNQFIKYYEGFDIQFATDEEIRVLSETEQFASMPSYPYYGSVQKIDDYIVIKLSELE